MTALLGRVFLVAGFFLLVLCINHAMPLPSGLHSFCWKISWMPNRVSLVCNCFLFLLLKFFLITICHFNCYVSWCGPPWVDFIGGFLYLLDLDVYFLSPIREILAITFFGPLFSLLLLGSLKCKYYYTWWCRWVP